MVSTLKVNKIQIPNSDSDVISLDASSGNITVPKPISFSGTVTGTAMVKLLEESFTSAAAVYDISSTHINTTYGRYKLYYYLKPATDSVDLRARFFVGGSVVDASNNYAYETRSINGTSQVNETATYMQFTYDDVGSDTGEGVSGSLDLQNINNALFPASIVGLSNTYKNATHNSTRIGASYKRAGLADAINGLRFFFSSGNIAEGTIELYGLG